MENKNQDFFERLRQNPRPVVVDFWASWCGPCKMIEPQLKKLSGEYEGRVDLWKVNADEQPELLRQLKIYGIPTLVGFKDGAEVFRQTGAGNYSTLAGIFEGALNGERPEPVAVPLTIVDRVPADNDRRGAAVPGLFTGTAGDLLAAARTGRAGVLQCGARPLPGLAGDQAALKGAGGRKARQLELRQHDRLLLLVFPLLFRVGDIARLIGLEEEHLGYAFICINPGRQRRGVGDFQGHIAFPFRLEGRDVDDDPAAGVGRFSEADGQDAARDAEVFDRPGQGE